MMTYNKHWDELINSWLTGETSDSSFKEFIYLISIFRGAFKNYEKLSLDIKETMAEFIGVIKYDT